MGAGRPIVFLAALSAVLLVACGQDVTPATKEGSEALSFPSQILGLKVELEKPGKDLEGVERPYFDRLALFSLREGELLRSSLQVARFNSVARPGSATFRRQLLQGIGTKEPRTIRVGKQLVHVTAGNRQNIFVWFKEDGLLVLVTHQDYAFPRTLLRRIIALDLKV